MQKRGRVQKMVDRNRYDSILNSLSEISKHYSECKFEASIGQLCSFKTSFDIKLMFVGHFSAGKSALLNGLLERPGFLKEAQLPQTAVATELRYDQNECAFAYPHSGGKEPLTEQAASAPGKYSHLEYRLAAPALAQISDYTIVDTPGFDSGVEAHAKALSGYIGMGSAYIMVVDQEKGGIDGTTLDFLKEISQYSSQIAVLINKCDKITPATAEKIAAAAQATLRGHGFSFPVYTISARDRDVGQKLVSIISAFDAQAAFDRAMERQIRSELVNLGAILGVTRQKLYLDTFDLDEEIRAYTRAEEHTSEVFAQKRTEATQSLDVVTEQVVAQIRSALIARADSITEALLTGNQTAAEAIIVETIRPIMLSSVKDISIRQIENVAAALDFTGLADAEDQEALSEVACNLAKNLKDLILQDAFEDEDLQTRQGDDSKKAIYRAATGLAAILTDIIAPWMEVIIILLPDIITLLKGMFGESDSERVKHRFINNVLPQICNKLYPQVRSSIEASTQQVLAEYQSLMGEKLEQFKASIAAAEAKKKEREDTFESYKKHLDEDTATVQDLIRKMG